jgi:hypothetical protein
MKSPLKKAYDAAKNSKVGKAISDNKGVIAGAVANAGVTAYAWRKAGGKAGLIAGAGSIAWTGLSYAYFKTLEAQEKAERGETAGAPKANAPKTEPVADPFAAARRKRRPKKGGDGPTPE